MYTLRFCTQTLFHTIDDINYDTTPFKFNRHVNMLTTVTANNKSDLVDLAYQVHQWQGAFSSFEEEEVLEVINQKTSIVTFSLGSGMAGDVIHVFCSGYMW